MIGFGLFVILDFGFVRVQEQRLEIVIFFGVMFGRVDNKLFDSIIFAEFEIGLTVLFAEAVFSFKLIDVI